MPGIEPAFHAARRRRIPRWLANPWVTAALLIALLCETRWVASHSGRAFITYAPWVDASRKTLAVVVHRSAPPHEMRVLFPDEESWGEASSLLQDSPAQTTGFAYWFIEEYRPSWWAPTLRRRGRSIEAISPSALPTGVLVDMRRAALAAIEARGFDGLEAEQREALAVHGSWVSTTVLWGGYIHNAAAAVGAIGLVLSLAWVPEGWRAARRNLAAARGRRRLERGQCPACGYSVAGLSAGVCPECGLVLMKGGE